MYPIPNYNQQNIQFGDEHQLLNDCDVLYENAAPSANSEYFKSLVIKVEELKKYIYTDIYCAVMYCKIYALILSKVFNNEINEELEIDAPYKPSHMRWGVGDVDFIYTISILSILDFTQLDYLLEEDANEMVLDAAESIRIVVSAYEQHPQLLPDEILDHQDLLKKAYAQLLVQKNNIRIANSVKLFNENSNQHNALWQYLRDLVIIAEDCWNELIRVEDGLRNRTLKAISIRLRDACNLLVDRLNMDQEDKDEILMNLLYWQGKYLDTFYELKVEAAQVFIWLDEIAMGRAQNLNSGAGIVQYKTVISNIYFAAEAHAYQHLIEEAKDKVMLALSYLEQMEGLLEDMILGRHPRSAHFNAESINIWMQQIASKLQYLDDRLNRSDLV